MTVGSVFSISYGFSELYQCDLVAIDTCKTLGYNAQQYVNRVESNFMKLANMGVSIFVADGDDGSADSMPLANEEIDPDWWCPKGGCGNHTESLCSQITIKNVTSGKKCTYPTDAKCEFVVPESDFEEFLKNNNSNCELEIYQFHYLYSMCDCKDLDLNYLDIVGSSFVPDSSQGIFMADFPASSAYVTSVGATQILGSMENYIEVPASLKTGAPFTTGGGFSSYVPSPSWQKDAVTEW